MPQLLPLESEVDKVKLTVCSVLEGMGAFKFIAPIGYGPPNNDIRTS